jgi:two-component system, sensor histidine kinase
MSNRPYRMFSTPGTIASANSARKLRITVGLFVFIIVCVLAVDHFRTENLSAIRAYVQAEGSWSKTQKEAVIDLRRYERSHEEKDYQGYLAAVAIPLGDRQARIELEKTNPDLSIVYRDLLQGGNHPNDVKGMASLFLRFRNIRYMSDAIETWTQGDRYIVQLEGCAELLHAEIGSSRKDPRVIEDLLTQLEDIDARLTPIENRFSEQMSAGARAVSYFLSYFLQDDDGGPSQ